MSLSQVRESGDRRGTFQPLKTFEDGDKDPQVERRERGVKRMRHLNMTQLWKGLGDSQKHRVGRVLSFSPVVGIGTPPPL